MIECSDCEEYIREINGLESELDEMKSRLDRLEAALREIAGHPCWLIKMGWKKTCAEWKTDPENGGCGPCVARAALAAQGGEK